MPVIPQLQEGQRLDQSRAIEAESVSEAGLGSRLRAQGLNSLAAEGREMLTYAAQQKELAKRLDVDNFREEAEMRALEFNDKAMKESAADGSDITQIFNQNYDEYYKERLSQVKDPDAAREARAEALNIRNAMNAKLFETGRAKFADYGLTTSRRMQKQASAGVYNNPDQPDLYSSKGYEAIKRVAPMLGKDNQYKETITFEGEFARSRIEGYVARANSSTDPLKAIEDFDKARQALRGDHAGAFDEKERKELMDNIDAKQFAYINRRREDIRWYEDRAKKQLEETQKQNFMKLYNGMANGENIDDERTRLAGLGGLSTAQDAILERKEDKVDQLTSDGSYYNFVGRAIVVKQPVNEILLDVARARQEGRIKPERAAELTKWLYDYDKQKKDKKFSDPAFKAKERANDKTLRARFGVSENPFALSFQSGEKERLYAAASERYVDLVYFKGVSQDEAMRIIKKEKGGFVDTVADVPAIPGLNRGSYTDPNAIEGAKKAIKKKASQGEYSPEEYNKHLKALKKLKDVTEAQDRWQEATE